MHLLTVSLPANISSIPWFLIQVCKGALFDAGLIFLTFIASILGLSFTTQRAWLKVHVWMVLGCIIVTLVIGLQIWYSTLQTRANLAVMWDAEGPQIQQLLQQRVSHLAIPYRMVNADLFLSGNVADI